MDLLSGKNVIRILPPKQGLNYPATHYIDVQYTCDSKNSRCPVCRLTNPSDPGKVKNMKKQKIELGQIRRWNLIGLTKYVWRVVALPGDQSPQNLDGTNRSIGEPLGLYLLPGQDPVAKVASGVKFTCASTTFMEAHSEVVVDPYLTIDVTQEDIDEGTCSSISRCAISLASLRAVKKRFRRWKMPFTQTGERLVVKDLASIYPKFAAQLPVEARQFVNTYDGREGKKEAKPFSFRVPLPRKLAGRKRLGKEA